MNFVIKNSGMSLTADFILKLFPVWYKQKVHVIMNAKLLCKSEVFALRVTDNINIFLCEICCVML